MKRILTAALALSLLAGAVAEAKPGGRRGGDGDGERDRGRSEQRGSREVRGDRERDGDGPGRWGRGQTLPPSYRDDAVDYRASGLRRPPNGYGWVRVGPDYLLMDSRTGLVLDVIPGR